MDELKPQLPATVLKLSLKLQVIAEALDDILKETAGTDVSFVLLCYCDNVSQYTANVTREEGKAWIKEMLERWESVTVEVPAHLNQEALTDPSKDPDLH